MTKKIFTEEQCRKITDCFDKLKKEYYFGLLNENVVEILDQELRNIIDTKKLWQEIVAIANPVTRDEAKEKYVEKEKRYFWKTKKTDRHGKPRRLAKDEDGAIYFIGRVMKLGHTSKITETELREWGYIPEMFDREEAE